MYEMKTKDFYEDFSSDKKCLIAVFLQLSQNTMVIKKKLVIGKMKPEALRLKNLLD